jgi:hypothetical protein
MTFAVISDPKHKLNLIDQGADWAFREALLRGAPPPTVRPLMKQALDRIPKANAAAYSRQYFGKELPEILARCQPLIDELHVFFHQYLKLPGFMQWLNATGYGNDYLMIKAFAAWSELKLEKPLHLIVPEHGPARIEGNG